MLHRDGLPAAVRYYFDGRLGLAALCLPLITVHLALVVLAAWGGVRRWRDRRPERIPLALLFGYFFLPPGPVAEFRFQVPLVPVMALWGDTR